MGLNEDLSPPNHLFAGPFPWDTPQPRTQAQDAVPVEILIRIISLLARPELAICSRVSRRLYEIAGSRLYCDITVDLEAGINPLFDKPAPRPRFGKLSRAMDRLGLGRRSDRVEGGIGDRRGNGAVPAFSTESNSASFYASAGHRPLPLPHRFTFILHLTIRPHHGESCSRLPILHLPNLQSLRIFPSIRRTPHNLCNWHHPFPNGHCASCQTCRPCPLSSSLQPRKLILGGDRIGLEAMEGIPWKYVDPPPLSVKEAVVHIGACSGMELGQEGWILWMKEVSKRVERLSLMIQPSEREWYKRVGWRITHLPSGGYRYEPAQTLWDLLGRSLAGEAREYVVVGLETVDRGWSGLSLKDEVEAVRKATERWIVKKGKEAVDAKARAEGLVFMGRAEYDQRQEQSL